MYPHVKPVAYIIPLHHLSEVFFVLYLCGSIRFHARRADRQEKDSKYRAGANELQDHLGDIEPISSIPEL